jgi:hypothetical protein
MTIGEPGWILPLSIRLGAQRGPGRFLIPPGSRPPTCNLGFDPAPENTRIELNRIQRSGFNPAPGFPGADLVWTGTGTGDCWLRNIAAVSFPPQLPRCSEKVAEQ